MPDYPSPFGSLAPAAPDDTDWSSWAPSLGQTAQRAFADHLQRLSTLANLGMKGAAAGRTAARDAAGGLLSIPQRAWQAANPDEYLPWSSDEPREETVNRARAGTALDLLGTIGGPPIARAALSPGAAGELGALGGYLREEGGSLGATGPDALPPEIQALRGKWSKYADQYPEVSPPVLMKRKDPDIKGSKDTPVATGWSPEGQQAVESGTHFWSKGSTPELDEFMTDRNTIDRYIDEHPEWFAQNSIYPAAQRKPVDPSFYPTNTVTARDAVPKRQNTPIGQQTLAKYVSEYDTPEARARIRDAYDAGLTVPDADRWYHTGQVEDDYRRLWGDENQEGRRRYASDFAGQMASTTGGADPTANWLMAANANNMAEYGYQWPKHLEGLKAWQAEKGRPTDWSPQWGAFLPKPIGGRYAGGNMERAREFVESGDPWDINNPKRFNFQFDFLGHPGVTMDEVMSNLIKPGMNMPSKVGYGIAERPVIAEANAAGVSPEEYQGITWAGAKKMKTEERNGPGSFNYEGPMVNHLSRSALRTGMLTGDASLSPLEAARGAMDRHILRRLPMYGLGGVGISPVLQQLWQSQDDNRL